MVNAVDFGLKGPGSRHSWVIVLGVRHFTRTMHLFILEYKWVPQTGLRLLNTLTPMSDQDRISPYNINTKSRSQVMRT